MNRRGMLIVLSGPSGSGKGTIIKSLLQQREDTVLSISVTTRAPRPGEEDGVHYFFRTREDLDRWAEAAANTSADKIKVPKAKGRLNAAEKRCFQQLLCDAYHLQTSTLLTDREKETAARLLLYILPSVINICGKEGDRDIINFMDGSRRSYAFEVKNLPACSAWLTVAGGKGKITSGQGTKLPIYFSLAFDSPDEAISYFHGTEDFRTEINRKAIHFCGADAYALRDQSRIEAERYAFEQMIRHVFRVI